MAPQRLEGDDGDVRVPSCSPFQVIVTLHLVLSTFYISRHQSAQTAGTMLPQSRAPPQNGFIGIKRAYEAFNNDARNTWLEQLEQKIKRGRNPPEDPGPSRSPSPYETAEGDLITSISNDLGDIYAGEEERVDEMEEDGTDGQYDDDEDEEDISGPDDDDAHEVYGEEDDEEEDEEVEEEEQYEDEDSQGAVAVGEPVIAETAEVHVQRVTADITLPRPSQQPPRTQTNAVTPAQTSETLAAFETVSSAHHIQLSEG